jgi:hypothetical protein
LPAGSIEAQPLCSGFDEGMTKVNFNHVGKGTRFNIGEEINYQSTCQTISESSKFFRWWLNDSMSF